MNPISPDALAKWQVLVIDDEEDNLAVASMMLEMAGSTVYQAYDGSEGLKALQDYAIDFVICDISMPVMDGWQFIKAVRDDKAQADLPVIALTAHAMPGDRERAVENGFNAYLTKPLDPEKFIDQIVKLLAQIPAFQQGVANSG